MARLRLRGAGWLLLCALVCLATQSRALAGRPTGVLQLLSATEPAPPLMADAEESPTPEPELPEPTESTGSGSQPLHWSNPYQMGSAQAAGGPAGIAGWLPLGMNPWGPRTPLSQRSTGWGEPLTGSSWLNRPFNASWFAGPMWGSQLIDGRASQRAGFYGGYRVGWDYDFYWGMEARLGASSLGVKEPYRLGDPGTNNYWNLDVNLLWYPWGDCKWRPYMSVGFGMAQVAFFDWQNRHNHYIDRTLIGVPVGVGLKYRWTDWVALRGELMNNIGIGTGAINTIDNVALTAGVEFSFGGVRRSYWPWNPGKIIH